MWEFYFWASVFPQFKPVSTDQLGFQKPPSYFLWGNLVSKYLGNTHYVPSTYLLTHLFTKALLSSISHNFKKLSIECIQMILGCFAKLDFKEIHSLMSL